MVKESESEWGTQIHRVKKIRDLMRQAEIGINKQAEAISQVIRYIMVQRQKARE